jgi:hypothetical protein
LRFRVEIDSGREISKTEPTKEVVRQASAGFKADVAKPYTQVVREALFGKDTAISKAHVLEKD